ncbi:MAG: hypothetical protein H0T73_01270, partial [Ardenticatenales bacterium]|nr:hypothetical protein [Ardenticatenales bacterium]
VDTLPFRRPPNKARLMLLRYQRPDCDQNWIFLYDPEQGTIQQWLMESEYARSHGGVVGVWDPLEETVILVHSSEVGDPSYTRLREEPRLLVPRSGAVFDEAVYHWLFITREGQWVLPLWPTPPTSPDTIRRPPTLVLLDPLTQQQVASMPLAATGDYSIFLTGGEEIFYMLWPMNPERDAPAIGRVDWEQGEAQVLLQGDLGQSLMLVGTSPDETQLLVLVSRREEGGTSTATRLLKLNLTQPEASMSLDIPEGTLGFNAAACADGTVLYQVMQSNIAGELHRWLPDGSTELIIPTTRSWLPRACW